MTIESVLEYVKAEYGIEAEYPWHDSPDCGTLKDKISGKWFAVFMPVRRERLGLEGSGFVNVINVKADPDFILFMAGRDGYLPGYHMNKRHWISLRLDGTLPDNEVMDCIDRSYRLVADTPSRRIYEAVKKIPKGKVATYGQVAEMAGDKKMARAVGNALHKNPDPDSIPCFRVVNAKGELAGEFAFGGLGAQAKLLAKEGIEVINGKVDLNKYGI